MACLGGKRNKVSRAAGGGNFAPDRLWALVFLPIFMAAILQRSFHRRLLVADFYERSVIVHEQLRGKIGIVNKIPIESQDDLSTAYTPGVRGPAK